MNTLLCKLRLGRLLPILFVFTVISLYFMLAKAENPTAAGSLTARYSSFLTPPPLYEAFRAVGKIKIDGKLNEGSWAKATPASPFKDIRGNEFPAPAKDTEVKMMWDDEYLYIGAILQEDNIIARLSQRDTIIYHDNDFEVFLDPDGDGINYYEFETNARGTLLDLMLDKPYRSGGTFFIPWNCEGLKLAVCCDGTLNKPSDSDKSWSVEMAIPFSSLRRDFKDPRDFKLWRVNFSRVQWLVPGQPEENWVWAPTGKIDIHMPERWGFLRFIDAPVGTKAGQTDFNLDLDAYRLIWSLFYAQQDNYSRKRNYIRRTEDFRFTPNDLKLLPAGGEIKVEASSKAFEISIEIPSRKELYTVNQDGRFDIMPVSPKTVKNWVWTGIHNDRTPGQWKEWYSKLYDAGISAVLFEGYDSEIYRACKESGLEAHYWKWTLNRRDFLKSHPEWYAVNHNGDSSSDKPAYVDYYRFLCPSRQEVIDSLAEDYLQCSILPYVDGMHLDYIRIPDVILPVSLWKNYGIEQTYEMPQYDYCYCEVCREKFKRLTGLDPIDIKYPMENQAWLNFRLDAVSTVVKGISDRLHADGKYLSAAVFPGPSMAKKMVRQDWGNWQIDACFPMIYHGFYNANASWVGRSVKEGVDALHGRADLFAGIMCTDCKGNEFIEVVDEALRNGADGISFFSGPSDEQLAMLKRYLIENNLRPQRNN